MECRLYIYTYILVVHIAVSTADVCLRHNIDLHNVFACQNMQTLCDLSRIYAFLQLLLKTVSRPIIRPEKC